MILDILKTKEEADVEINSMMISRHDDQGLKCWFCGVCDYSNKKKDLVFRHVDLVHYNFSYCCEACGKITPTQNALFFHKREYHK